MILKDNRNVVVRILSKIWNNMQKCYMCKHPYFIHHIGKVEMYCRMCECCGSDDSMLL